MRSPTKGTASRPAVVDHATGRLVWAGEGRNSETLGRFFDELGAARAARLTHVFGDERRDPHSGGPTRTGTDLPDPFHVVAWAWPWTRWGAHHDHRDPRSARDVGDAQKNPADLTGEQRTSPRRSPTPTPPCTGPICSKRQLREVFRAKGATGRQLLAGWLSWASHSRIPEFVTLARTIRRYRNLIWNTLDHGLSNAKSGSHQHPPAGIDQTRLRIPQPRRTHRHGHAHPGGLCPALGRK